MRRFVILALILLALAYSAFVGLLWWQQDQLVFPGASRGQRSVDVPHVRVLQLPGPRGLSFRVAECVPTAPRAVVLHFVGNGEDLLHAASRAAEFAVLGFLAISPEYPGYGGSAGRPGVASFLGTADAAADYAQQRARELGIPLAVSGSSLGSCCAVHVAASGRATRMLLRSPLTTLVAVARHHFCWLPVGLVLRHTFDNLTPAAAVLCPVLIVHGEADTTVPLSFGQQLRSAFRGPTELIVVPGAGHNDLLLAADAPHTARVAAFLCDR